MRPSRIRDGETARKLHVHLRKRDHANEAAEPLCEIRLALPFHRVDHLPDIAQEQPIEHVRRQAGVFVDGLWSRRCLGDDAGAERLRVNGRGTGDDEGDGNRGSHQRRRDRGRVRQSES